MNTIMFLLTYFWISRKKDEPSGPIEPDYTDYMDANLLNRGKPFTLPNHPRWEIW